MKIENIIFDFGGVLVDWNPRHLYRDYFDNEQEMEYFLRHVCTEEWNLEQDRGRPLSEGTRLLQEKYPDFHSMIQLFYDKWEVMLKGDIPETVSLLYQLKAKFKIYGLTNWSAETIPVAFARFPFFSEFDGIVVSGKEKLIKPDKQIFKVLVDRYNLLAENTVFIDDNEKNVNAAREIGMNAIRFESPDQLEKELRLLKAI
jgi:2-haloacid dehalogenase